MKPVSGNDEAREQIIAGLLWYGTWIASALVAAGIVVRALQPPDHPFLSGLNGLTVMKAGVALFIVLPVARVALMLVIFLREHDYLYTAISALVLAIIAAGVLVGL